MGDFYFGDGFLDCVGDDFVWVGGNVRIDGKILFDFVDGVVGDGNNYGVMGELGENSVDGVEDFGDYVDGLGSFVEFVGW